MILSKTESREGQIKTGQIAAFFADMMALFKGIVLIANVLPVFIGFWLALVFTNISFAMHLNLFFLTIIGSTLVMAGALVLNNWYEVDLDTAMDRTQIRPTVTGRISLKAALILGIVLSIIGFVFLAFTTWEAVSLCVYWMVYVCDYVYDVDKTQIYLQYDCGEHFWSCYTVDWVGGGCFCQPHCSYCSVYDFIHLANAAYFCNCDEKA